MTGRVPVLCYHRIGGPAELGVTRVGASVFARQMTALANAGWRTLSLDAFGAVPRGGHSFFLSFDDGYASLADQAYPLLADLGFTATTFLVTDYIGRRNEWDVRYTWRRLPHLDWTTIERWQARGFGFGSHSAAHRRLPWLDDGALADDLARSRGTLVRRLGDAAGRAIAYPFGAADVRVERAARAAGYELGFGGVRGDVGNPFHLPRVPVYFWDRGDVPFGLRAGPVGGFGRTLAHLANRCAVGTSLMLRLARRSS